MELFHNRGRLRGFKAYFPKVLKFYSLKNEYLTPAVFTVMLAVSFLGNFITSPVQGMDITTKVDIKVLPLYLIVGIIMKLVMSLYLITYIRELKGEAYSIKECFSLILRRSFKILIASAIYTMSTTVILAVLALSGFFILALPILVLYVMYMFNTCYIVDKNSGIFASFKASRNATKGSKWKIFTLSFAFSVLFLAGSMFMLGMFATSGNMLIYTFVLYFMLTIFNLMNERLTALMYYDLEYGRYIKEPHIDEQV